jgi:hypothetical protein
MEKKYPAIAVASTLFLLLGCLISKNFSSGIYGVFLHNLYKISCDKWLNTALTCKAVKDKSKSKREKFFLS